MDRVEWEVMSALILMVEMGKFVDLPLITRAWYYINREWKRMEGFGEGGVGRHSLPPGRDSIITGMNELQGLDQMGRSVYK